MSKSSAAVFLKWIVFEKSSTFPKMSNEITTNPLFPRRERNIPLIREYVENLNDNEVISEFNEAWNEYRIMPRIANTLKPLLPGGYRK